MLTTWIKEFQTQQHIWLEGDRYMFDDCAVLPSSRFILIPKVEEMNSEQWTRFQDHRAESCSRIETQPQLQSKFSRRKGRCESQQYASITKLGLVRHIHSDENYGARARQTPVPERSKVQHDKAEGKANWKQRCKDPKTRRNQNEREHVRRKGNQTREDVVQNALDYAGIISWLWKPDDSKILCMVHIDRQPITPSQADRDLKSHE